MRCRTLLGSTCLLFAVLAGAPATADLCELPDNGNGTVFLPPEGCPYLSPMEFHLIVDGLPPDTEIVVDASHERFLQIEREPDGEGGENERFDSFLVMQMTGTGELDGFVRNIAMPIMCEANTGPRGGGEVQQFPTEMKKLQGEILGDSDFAELRITAGSDFGLPSPGETTLTRLDNGNWNVDSFFDVEYRIEFVGAAGSVLEGMEGTTQQSVRMGAGDPASGDRGACCRGTECTIETREDCADGCVRDPEWQCDGDTDGDGQVNPVDSGLVQAAFGSDDPADLCQYDMDCDGQINPVDSGIVQSLFGTCDPPRRACGEPGRYQGPGTDCDPNPCLPRGACCLPDGTCVEVTREACARREGAYQGDDTFCADVECRQPIGACCLRDGTCIEVTREQCAQDEGVYQGDFVSCDEIECPRPTGACCLPTGECVDGTTREECGEIGGKYQGDDTTCDGVDCLQPFGACCLRDGTCVDGTTRDECAAREGEYQGDNTDCGDVQCPQPLGACCLADGTCIEVTREQCAQDEGVYQGDFVRCAEIECPRPTGACCLPDGTCVDGTTREECAAREGQYQGDDTDCANVQCPQPRGACCLRDGTCIEITEEQCAQDEGVYQGDFVGCAEIECPRPVGACCLTDGNCVDGTTREECGGIGGNYQGDDTTCDGVECPLPTGACCLRDGTCVDGTTRQECADRGGEYQGDDTDCANVQCPQPIGACCLRDGTCIEVTREQCAQDEGVYQGDFVGCDEVECPRPTGACCLPDGTCVDGTTREECAAREGQYQGDDTDCANVQCPQPLGACCLTDGTCIEITEEHCNEDGGTYQGDFVTCAEIECPRPVGACCLADGNCVDGTTREECGGIGGDYQGDDTTCDGIECPPAVGACCLHDGTCIDVTREECVDRRGRYQGDGTDCALVECPQPGACCLPDGTCAPLLEEVCRALRGLFRGEGAECPADCADAPGACCIDGGGGGDPCEQPDNGNGTVHLPPEGCGYVSPQRLHHIIDGLPPGTEIIIDPIHLGFINIQRQPDGEGGEFEQFGSTLLLRMRGTGELEGFQREIELEAQCLAQTGPRNLGEDVQTFPNEMLQLQGELFGDPDFEQLRIIAGTEFGLPSPGQTTLTRLTDRTWNVDSFFDVEYRIEFVGARGSVLEGLRGETQGNADMRAGGPLGGRRCIETVRADCDRQGGDFYMGRTCDEIDCINLIPPGPDCWITECGDTDYDFCETPIPADFFDPGSDPFEGRVILGGAVPGQTDTQVNRLGQLDLRGPPPLSQTVDIQLVQLDLVSCQPITVDIGGEATRWDVEVHLSDVEPPPGRMRVTKEHENGGVFQSEFSVQPVFIFTRVDDPSVVRILDTGLEGLDPDRLTHPRGAPWVFRLRGPGSDGCGRNFNPGAHEDPGTGKQCCRKICHPGATATHCNVVGYDCSGCPDGACCLPDGTCEVVSATVDRTAEAVCEEVRGGDYQGDSTTCADDDGDGIPDVYENNECGICSETDRCDVPTDPSNPDTDGDGCLDGDELAAGTDPCDPCSYSASCVTNPCGACCHADGTCSDDVPANQCPGRHFPETRCTDDLCAVCVSGDCRWDNNMTPNGVNGRALSPPNFPDIRVADDFVVAADCTLNALHANVIEDSGWTDGGDGEVCIYADTAGSGPGAALACITVPLTKTATGDAYFGRDDYDYCYDGLNTILVPGTYWIGHRNPNGGGAGTNYWMTSDGGPDGIGSDTGWFSLDAGGTWSPEGADWHHAFEIDP